MATYMKTIREKINQFPANQVIVAADLYHSENFDMMPEQTYFKYLGRLTKAGELVHLTKGLYYRPKSGKFGIIPISDEEIIAHYLGKQSGIVVGYRLYNSKGITTQISKRVNVLSNALREDQKNIKNITIKRIDIEFNERNVAVIETLEILQNYSHIEDVNTESFLKYMESFVRNYSDETVNYVINHVKYKKSTIAFLNAFLNRFNIKNTLGQYLSPMSNYKIPDVEVLYEITSRQRGFS